MKKNIITIFYIVIILISHNIYSQDIITKKDGTDIKAKVSEISDSEVKYKKYENLDGPTYSLLKSEILLIRYENGTKDVFTENFIEQSKPEVDNLNANLVVYREKQFAGSIISYKLYANDKVIAKINNGCLYEFTFPAGSYEFLAKTESRSVIAKKLESGNTYYLKCGIKMGIFVGKPHLMFVDESMALAQISNLTKTESDVLLASQADEVKPVDEESILQNTYGNKSKNAAYFELLGAGGAFSANYERIIFEFEKNRLSLRAGIGVMPFDGFWSLSFPISCNLITGSGNNHFEIGFGITPDTYSDVFLNFIVGYRFQKPTNGFLFKANMNFLYEPFWGAYLPLPGFSVGYAF